MFFNKKKREAAKIFNRAQSASVDILEVKNENGLSLKDELGKQIETGKWVFYATIAGVFLGFQGEDAALSEAGSRELAQLVNDLLLRWDKSAPESFYDLADFIITSREKGVDSASAAGLWVLVKVKEEMPGHDEMTMAHNIGHLLNRAVV